MACGLNLALKEIESGTQQHIAVYLLCPAPCICLLSIPFEACNLPASASALPSFWQWLLSLCYCNHRLSLLSDSRFLFSIGDLNWWHSPANVRRGCSMRVKENGPHHRAGKVGYFGGSCCGGTWEPVIRKRFLSPGLYCFQLCMV